MDFLIDLLLSDFFSLFWIMFASRDGHSVLVHGFDGTDSTLLISTLAQLIMDPCCRTLEGFLALLEREWVQVSVSGSAGILDAEQQQQSGSLNVTQVKSGVRGVG